MAKKAAPRAKPDDNWIPIGEVFAMLGRGYHRNRIVERIKAENSDLIEGVHWADVSSPSYRTPIYHINIDSLKRLIYSPVATR